jgi:putative PIN family toxin of toxin-antitoxin system
MSKDDPRPRVVFDCMIFLQATASESGPAAALLRLVERDVLSLFVSREILDELRDVLSRPKIQKNNPDITIERVDALITRVSERALSSMPFPSTSAMCVTPRMRNKSISPSKSKLTIS